MPVVFTHLRSFNAVAEHHGFTAAARALNVSQPTVTTQVKELEARYGVELVVRMGRRVELTDTGAALYEISRGIMRLHEEASELLHGAGRLTMGHLRVAAIGPFHAIEMVSRFLQDYPGVKVSMLLGNSDQTLQRILDLKADVGLLAHVVDDERICSIPFSTHEVVVFVDQDHPWSGRDSIRIHELADQRLILREQGSTTRRGLERALQVAGMQLRPFLEIGSREGVWKAVERGLGVGVVADFEFVPHPRLRTVRFSDADVHTEYRLVCLEARRNTPKIKAFFGSVLAGSSGDASKRAPGGA